jgi:hypothetical protein
MAVQPAPTWNPDFARFAPVLAPLRTVAEKLPRIGWPNVEVLNHVAAETGRRIVNARGQRIVFTAPRAGGPSFEARTLASGEVEVRFIDWHDLLNALVWITYPTAKAAINGRHNQAFERDSPGQRSPERDALTHFDEDGVVVLSADPELNALIRGFAWKELFWRRREAVQRHMRFFLFGHALYEKALAPFVGMTGKALLFDVPPDVLARPADALRAEVDRLTALHVWNPQNLLQPRELAPLPVLGVPGWWPDNGRAEFYDDTDYFRSGRRGDAASAQADAKDGGHVEDHGEGTADATKNANDDEGRP